MTKLSPALVAIDSASPNSRAVGGGEIDLAGAAAADHRQLGERRLGGLEGVARAAAGAVDEAGGEALPVVEKDLQDVFGG